MVALVLHYDGGARSNPGPAGAGAAIARVLSDGTHSPLLRSWRWLGMNTNNEAEYEALLLGLGHILCAVSADARAKYAPPAGGPQAIRLPLLADVTSLDVIGDSQLVTSQVFGTWKCNKQHLVKLRDDAQRLVGQLRAAGVAVSGRQKPRKFNAEADKLANRAMDTQHSGSEVGAGLASLMPAFAAGEPSGAALELSGSAGGQRAGQKRPVSIDAEASEVQRARVGEGGGAPSSADARQIDGLDAVSDLSTLVAGLPLPAQAAALLWCVENDAGAASVIVESAAEHDFVAALGLNPGKAGERMLRARLAAMRRE